MSVVQTRSYPERIETQDQLLEILTRPSPRLVDFVRELSSPLLILGAGGKMGPTLAVLAKRAALAANCPLEVIAVSRFSNVGTRDWLDQQEVKTLACDLLAPSSLNALPDAKNVLFLAGQKFGSAQDPASTWAVNTVVPARVAERYPDARIVALSTGNVYPLSEVSRGGALETDPLGPVGEYATTALGRERVFEFYSRRNRAPVALIRLFYAIETRYGVLVDIAGKVETNEPIDLANGYFNCIWQGDANEMILRALSLAASPPSVWNLCRREIFSVRATAARFGELLQKEPRFAGAETPTALLGNSTRICEKLGAPTVTLDEMLGWIAGWVRMGGHTLNKPTHFEVRDGKY